MASNKLTRREALALPFLGGLAAPAATATDPRPNILFILVDDLRYNAVGYAGHPFVKTPNIDRIAKEGVVFENAFVTTPLCSPSRASFLTGRYVRSHKVYDNTDHNELSHQLVTWPKLLQDAGYETCYTGKWHMGNDSTPRPGFDRWVSFKGQGTYNDPLLNIDGTDTKAPGYITDLLTGYAVDFLKKPHAKPFVLYLAHKAVHGPFTPAERHKDLFANETITRQPNAQDNWDGKPALQRDVNGHPPPKGPGPADQIIKNQLRCVTAIDEGIGKILQTLKETGQMDNTLIVFTSDNGYFWGEHHLGDKRWAYEESLRIPMAMRYPKLIKAGRKVSELVMNVDMAPTMLALGGGKAPAELQGSSVMPLLKGPVKNWRTSFLSEYFQEKGYERVPSWQAVRDDHYKFVHYTEIDGADELYDLKKDPYEMQNLVHDAPAALSEKKQQLDRYNKEIK